MKQIILLYLITASFLSLAQQDSVKLVEFRGLAVEGGVNIDWITDGEHNVNHFHLERSLDAIHFEPVCILQPLNSSTTEKHYHFSDEGIYRSTVYYRLQTQMSSSTEYSNIIAVVRNNMEELPDIMFFPTISESHINIVKNSDEDLTNAQVRIFSMSGVLVYNQAISGDFIKIQLDVSSFNRGAYLVELSKGKFASKTKFIKQ